MQIDLRWEDIQKVSGFSSFHLSPERWQAIQNYQNRFNIPQGLSQKELKELLKKTQENINICLKKVRELGIENGLLWDIEREDYVVRKRKIQKILKLHNGFGEMNIKKAKEYPIDNLIEFKGGFANCPFHGPEKTNSMKYYRERNKAHCFGCGMDADSIDIYQKINNADFNTAVKALS